MKLTVRHVGPPDMIRELVASNRPCEICHKDVGAGQAVQQQYKLSTLGVMQAVRKLLALPLLAKLEAKVRKTAGRRLIRSQRYVYCRWGCGVVYVLH